MFLKKVLTEQEEPFHMPPMLLSLCVCDVCVCGANSMMSFLHSCFYFFFKNHFGVLKASKQTPAEIFSGAIRAKSLMSGSKEASLLWSLCCV